MEATNKPSKANDFALAKAMNEQIYKTFVFVWMGEGAGVSEYHEIPDLNRAYVLLINELEKIYARNPELLAIKPEPLWRRFDVLKNHAAAIYDYINDTEDWGHEHNAKVEKLCIIAGVNDPDYTPEQQKLMETIDIHTKEYAAKGKEKLDNQDKDRQIPEYKLTFNFDGTILINEVLKLKKVHASSTTEKLLDQAIKNPNTLFKPDIGLTSRNLSTVLSGAGFTNELRALFFPVASKSRGVFFRPTVTRQQADEDNIDTTQLDIKLKELGAETEPKSA